MTTLIIVSCITILISASCSLFEAVLYSCRISTLEVAKKNPKVTVPANLMIQMKKNISETVSAILILNTIANTAGATVAGMFAVKALGKDWVAAYSAVLTLCILFLAEILPKSLGAIHWRHMWIVVVYPIYWLKIILYPLVKFSHGFASFFTGNTDSKSITEAELKALIKLGAKEGEISEDESIFVHNIINLEEKFASDILTPRTVMFKLPNTLKVKDALASIIESGYSRIPVHGENNEDITGYVLKTDLVGKEGELLEKRLVELQRKIKFYPKDSNCLKLLLQYIKTKIHIGIISDEYNGVAGLVTLEDLMETILGQEIVDETDRHEDLQKFAKEQFTMGKPVNEK